ncbi:MAG: histidine kinase dimerization/phosphoacceptor domain -containing protein [Anaerolineae bacterium]|jgi:two-component sensor histidine kinase
MRGRDALWWGGLVWAGGLVLGLAMLALYTWLPADGATGDLQSFTDQGYRVQWLLQERAGGLQVGDVIVRAGGYTAGEWLQGAPRGPEWRTGGVVAYEVLRAGASQMLQIRLAPIPLRAILLRWTPQFIVALAFLVVGAFVYLQRPGERPAQLLMIFGVFMGLQYVGDAYNIQYATLPWRWPLWFHLIYEHAMYGLSVATMAYFVLVFPIRHPWLDRFPRLVPAALYASFPLVIGGTMLLSPDMATALRLGNHASWLVALAQMAVMVAAGVRSVRTARDPVARAQIRWILWCGCIGIAVLVPGYILPQMLVGRPLVPHPVTMLAIVLIPFAFAIAILRYNLFAIDLVINRTLVYATLTVLLFLLYLVVVRVLTVLVELYAPGGNESVVVFVATLSLALAFEPLRRRVQSLIDGAFYRTKVETQRLLPEMSERLATSIRLDQLDRLLAQEVPRRLQLAWAALAVLDPQRGSYTPVSDGAPVRALPSHHPLAAYLGRRGEAVMRLQPPADLPPAAGAWLDQQQVELSVPLRVWGRLVGVYHLGPRRSGDAYSPDQMRLLQVLSQQAAVAVENSRLFQETERQAEELAGLHDAAVAISSSLEVEEVLSALAEQLARALDVQRVCIYGLDWEAMRATVLAEWRSFEPMDRRIDLGTVLDMNDWPSTLESVLAKEVLQFSASNPDLDPFDRTSAQTEGWQSLLVVPLVIRDRVIGLADLWEMRRDRRFTASEIQLCRTVAADAAAAIEHARLYEQARREITERKAIEAQITASLAEKDVLLKEIHHRVKNNLQVISSLLYLQSRQIRDPVNAEMFEESRHRVRSMALVHERLYQAPDLARVDFAEYVRSLISYLYQSYSVALDRVQVDVKVEPVDLGIDIAIPCGLILNELVTNALKHAFPPDSAGRIDVAFHHCDPDTFQLIVGDSGVGLPAGQEVWRDGSLGLQLVRTLVEQLGGSLHLDSGQGTRFSITFSDAGTQKEPAS